MFEHVPVDAFRKDLLNWWTTNKREYPWRKTRDPYSVLIAEVLLHRTRADQVAPVYKDFLEKFPNISEVKHSSVEELTSVMKPLGLFWRIGLLKEMAAQICARFDGKVPQNREDLESLPGVSHYIATAVRCFAFGCADALLDTNTVRIAGRILGIQTTDGSRRSKKFRDILDGFMDRDHPREFNFALIDFGALVCRSRSPLCNDCLFNKYCQCNRSITDG